MIFYAHTAEDKYGKALPEASGKWQPLSAHLRNVATLARQFGAGFPLERDAELAGLLHDLGKYSARFQARLRNPGIRRINHWAAGTTAAAAMRAWPAAFSAHGHHAGIPALNDNSAGPSLRETVRKFNDPGLRSELTGQCSEPCDELVAHFKQDGLQLPEFSPRPLEDSMEAKFAEAQRTRMTFSCLVDADFLDTEQHFQLGQSAERRVPVGQVAPWLAAGRGLKLLRCERALSAAGCFSTLTRCSLARGLRPVRP